MRLLLNPAPVDGGNTPAPAAAGQTPTPTPAPAPAQTTVSDQVLRELAELRTFKAQQDLAAQQRAEQDRLAEQQRLASKGQIEDVVKAHNEQLRIAREANQSLDRRIRETERSRAITSALSGQNLSYAEAASDLQTLWANDFETVDGPNGTFISRCKTTLRPVADVVAERLATPRYARFVKAESGGGGGPSGGANPAPTPNPNAPGQPATFEQQVMAAWNAARQTDASAPSGSATIAAT